MQVRHRATDKSISSRDVVNSLLIKSLSEFAIGWGIALMELS